MRWKVEDHTSKGFKGKLRQNRPKTTSTRMVFWLSMTLGPPTCGDALTPKCRLPPTRYFCFSEITVNLTMPECALRGRQSVYAARPTGQAPIKAIVPEARHMPLYCFINDPSRALQERGHVKPTATMADLLCRKQAAA